MNFNALYSIPIVFTSVCIVNVAVAAPELKGSRDELTSYLLDERKILVLSAQGEEKVSADKATLTLIVKTKEDRFKRALEKNKQIRERVKQSLQAGGIKPDAIRFSDYSNTPGYGWFGDKPSSYEVSNEMKVDISNESEMLVIADSIDSVKELYFVNLVFEHTGKQASEQQALKNALDKVNSKKQLLETSLMVKLTPIRLSESVYTEGDVAKIAPRAKLMQSADSYAESSPGAGTSAGFGEVIYRANIRVEYITSSN